jgi:hypothetical protein
VNRYLFFHRIKGPVIILVFGVTALLDAWHILSYGQSWPLYLIAIGLLQLAERAAWSQMQAPPPAGYSGYSGGAPPPENKPEGWGGSSSALSSEPRALPRSLGSESGGRE